MSGLISWPLGGQGSSEKIGSDADDVPPRSQMLRGGIPRAVNQGDRLAAPGSGKPVIHQFKAGLPSSQFQRLEPARQAASPRVEPTGLRGTREETVEQAPIMSSGDGLAGFHDQASTRPDRGPTLPGRTALSSFLPPCTRHLACCLAPSRFFVRQGEEKW